MDERLLLSSNVENGVPNGAKLVIPISEETGECFQIIVQEPDSEDDDIQMFDFESDLANSNYMRYYTSNDPSSPEVLHISSYLNKKLFETSENKYLRSMKIVNSKRKTNKKLDQLIFSEKKLLDFIPASLFLGYK